MAAGGRAGGADPPGKLGGATMGRSSGGGGAAAGAGATGGSVANPKSSSDGPNGARRGPHSTGVAAETCDPEGGETPGAPNTPARKRTMTATKGRGRRPPRRCTTRRTVPTPPGASRTEAALTDETRGSSSPEVAAPSSIDRRPCSPAAHSAGSYRAPLNATLGHWMSLAPDQASAAIVHPDRAGHSHTPSVHR